MFIKIALSLVLGYGLVLVICSSQITSKSSLDRFKRQSKSQLMQSLVNWCEIPPPLKNGRLRPSEKRCRPGNHFPACKMTPGVHVFPNWVLYLDYCNPGYTLGTANDVAACVNGTWLPRLPACVASNSSDECTQSETVATSKAVCRGEVIFEESFSGLLDNNWTRLAYINNANYKFNVFTLEEENVSIRNGSMVITPTLFEDAIVSSGTFEVKGCSANPNSKDCVHTDSYGILPPVASSAMSTYDSFSFRYGEVEIRAKLPVGDWLAPELLLVSKDSSYGSFGLSGFMRIVRRGNSDLQCDGEDLGRGRVELWVRFGPDYNRRTKEVALKNIPENWDDQYHNYTIIWKHGSISFKIDHEFVGEIAPEGKTLCEDFGFTQEQCKPYEKGSILAPFDKDFFLLIGLTAGNTQYFPDSCINRGKIKPWINYAEKDTLNFWEDRKNWHSTWTKERSSLYIDHIRVTAI